MKTINKDFVIARTAAWSKKISKLLQYDQPLKVKCQFRQGMTSSLALVETKKLLITYSIENINFARSVLFDWICGHEVAHIYADRLTGRYNGQLQPHGEEWRELMVTINLPPFVDFEKKELRKYLLWIDPDWGLYSKRKLANPSLTIIKFNSKKIQTIHEYNHSYL